MLRAIQSRQIARAKFLTVLRKTPPGTNPADQFQVRQHRQNLARRQAAEQFRRVAQGQVVVFRALEGFGQGRGFPPAN